MSLPLTDHITTGVAIMPTIIPHLKQDYFDKDGIYYPKGKNVVVPDEVAEILFADPRMAEKPQVKEEAPKAKPARKKATAKQEAVKEQPKAPAKGRGRKSRAKKAQ